MDNQENEKQILSPDESPQVKKRNKVAEFFRLTETKKVTYIAVLVAIAVATKGLSIPVENLKFSFFYLPCFLAGALFGPTVGFTTGAIADLLGTIVNVSGSSVPNAFITLGNALMGFIMGAVFKLRLRADIKLLIGAAISTIVCTLGINTIGLAIMYGSPENGFIQNYINMLIVAGPPIPIPRIIFQPIVVAINSAIFCPIYVATKRYLMRRLPMVFTSY